MIDRASLANLRHAFDMEHERTYSHCSPHKDVQIVNVRVTGVGLIDDISQQEVALGESTPNPSSIRCHKPVVFEVGDAPAWLNTPRYRRELLRGGNEIRGPAIVDQMDATTVLPPGCGATVDRLGNLVIVVPPGVVGQETWT
jgi:N-methylhydantoinase A/oxoprolinase/acetone carboxylase beta subunit